MSPSVRRFPHSDLDPAAFPKIAPVIRLGKALLRIDQLRRRKRKNAKVLQSRIISKRCHYGKRAHDAKAGIISRMQSANGAAAGQIG